MSGSKIAIFIGVLVVALGVLLTIAMREETGPLGIIFIAVGGVAIVLGISQRKSSP